MSRAFPVPACPAALILLIALPAAAQEARPPGFGTPRLPAAAGTTPRPADVRFGDSPTAFPAGSTRRGALPAEAYPRSSPPRATADNSAQSPRLGTRSSARAITPPQGNKDRTPRGGGSLWTTLGGLTVVIVLILIVARLWKKHGPRVSGAIPSEAFEILGKRHIDQRQIVHLVRLGARILVIGSSAQGLRTLAEITDPVEVDFLAGLCRKHDESPSIAENFGRLFTKQTETQPADHAHEEESTPREKPQEEPPERKDGLLAQFPPPPPLISTEDIRG